MKVSCLLLLGLRDADGARWKEHVHVQRSAHRGLGAGVWEVER